MRNITSFFIISAILIAIDFYCWQGVKTLITGWSQKAQNLTKYIYWGYTAFIFTYFLAWRMFNIYVSDHFARAVAVISAAILVAKVIWVLFLLVDDIIRLVRWITREVKGNANAGDDGNISRLAFLSYTGMILGSAFIGTFMYGVAKGAHNYQIKRRKLAIKGLPQSFDGLKIIQISDIHSGSFWSRKAVERGIQMILDEKPDVIFFTGDLVNDRAKEAEPWIELFSRLKAPMGVYSVLGNHDYGDYVIWGSEEEKRANLFRMLEIHKELGWDLLMNEHRILTKNGEKLAILGIENWSAKNRFPKYGDLSKAYQGTEEVEVKLLLSHDPSHWKAEVLPKYPDIHAVFSGHTHGFQFGIDSSHYRWSPVKYVYDEWLDLYTEKIDDAPRYLYVNRGFGYIGYPGRVGVLPEISAFTLEKA